MPSSQISNGNSNPTPTPNQNTTKNLLTKVLTGLNLTNLSNKIPRLGFPHRRPTTTPNAKDDASQTVYYHLQDAHNQWLLDDVNSACGQFRLKQREQRLVVQEGVGIRDFAFPRKAEIEAERGEEGKEGRVDDFERGRVDSVASPPSARARSGSPFICSLDLQQQLLLLRAWESEIDVPAMDEQQKLEREERKARRQGRKSRIAEATLLK